SWPIAAANLPGRVIVTAPFGSDRCCRGRCHRMTPGVRRSACRFPDRGGPLVMLDHGPLPAYIDGLINFGGLMAVRSADDGRYLLVNPAFEQLLGLPQSETLGRTVQELFPPATAEE